MIFKGTSCFQFPEAVITCAAKECQTDFLYLGIVNVSMITGTCFS